MPATDRLLFGRWVQHGDAESFQTIVNRHVAMVYATCRRILESATEAEAAARETFETFAKTPNAGLPSVAASLHAIATDCGVAKRKSDGGHEGREAGPARPYAPGAPAAWRAIAEHVDEAIAGLPAKLRPAVVAYFLEGQSQGAIAAEIGGSRHSAAARIDKGVEGVRRFLSKRAVTVETPALTEMMKANLAEATLVPASLTAALGQRPVSPATPAVLRVGGGAGAFGRRRRLAWFVASGLAAIVLAGMWWLMDSRMASSPEPGQPARDREFERDPARTTQAEDVRPTVAARSLGTIRGRIVDADTGVAVAGALVRLSGAETAESMADSSGRFRFGRLAHAAYAVEATHERWQMAGPPIAVQLAPGESTNIEIQMVEVPAAPSEPGTIITGCVRDVYGAPVADATVSLGVSQGHGAPVTGSLVRSKSDGAFAVLYQAPAPEWVSVAHPDYASKTVRLAPDTADSQYIEVVLNVAGGVEGIVSPAGVRRVTLHVSGGPGVDTLRTQTDADGRYRFDPVAPGRVTVVVADEAMAEYRCGAVVEPDQITVVDFDLEEGTCALSGEVTVQGTPALGGSVCAATALEHAERRSTATIQGGAYRFEGLVAGRARVQARTNVDGQPCTKVVWAELTKDTETVLDIEFSCSGALSGHVSGQSDDEWVAILVLAGEITELNGLETIDAGIPAVQTDPYGAFRIDLIEPGAYTIVARTFGEAPPPGQAGLSPYLRQGRAVVEVSEGEEAEVHIELP